jgi:hypothetical protein
MTVKRPSINFRTKQIVYNSGGALPYVGFENLDEAPDGWLYNIKRWCSIFDLRLPHLPRLADPSTQGVRESEYFKSGVGAKDSGDLYIDSIEELFRDNERHWVPLIRHGHYYRFKTPFFLYGDNSRVQTIDPTDNKDGKNYIELDVEPDMNSPIMAATFARTPVTRTPYYYVHPQQRAEFSGTFVDGAEQDTVTPLGKILWDNINTNKREFIVDNTIEGLTALRFNKDFTRTHGVVPTVFQDLAACEVLGMSDGSSYQVYYLKYFPVLPDTFHLYVATSSTWEEWTRVETWFELITSTTIGEKKFFLDSDLGIIYTGSASQGGVPPLGRTVVAAYTSTLRVEYEEADLSMKMTAWDADVSPVTQHINQGFVVITHDQLEAATIILEIDKPPISFTTDPVEHGPVLVGSDYAVLKATVKSMAGVAVPNIEVGFEMSPLDVGYLSGSTVATAVTNGRGEAFTSYQPPVSADALGFHTTVMRASTHGSYTSHKDLILNATAAGLEGKEEEIYLYQVLKDDLLLAYDSVDEWIYYNLDAPDWVVDATTYDQWKQETLAEHELKDWDTLNSGLGPYSPLAGRKVVVYKIDPDTENYDGSALHPVTGELGAVLPVRPAFVEQIDDGGDSYNKLCRVIYPEDAVPDCDPEDDSNNVGGYWVVSSRLVRFKAHCFSPYYNRTIYSNEVVARVSLPPYLLGEYVNSLGQKVPFGWKLYTDTDNVAAGIDGATFITINPHSGPYNIIDLVGGQTSEDWADAPFKSIGFQIYIEE